MSEEKRQSVRVRKGLMVQYSQQKDAGDIWRATSAIDLSESGISIETHTCFEPQERIYIRIRLPIKVSEWFLLPGRVVASNPGKVCKNLTRIAFDGIDEKQIELLRDYIAWILVKERGAR